MNKIIIVLIISLFFIEGCTVIGYSVGKGIHTKQSLEMEKIDSIEVNDWLSISLNNSEVINGQLISCKIILCGLFLRNHKCKCSNF